MRPDRAIDSPPSRNCRQSSSPLARPRTINQRRCAETLENVDQQHFAAIGLDDLVPDDLLAGVVATLHQNTRLDLRDQLDRRIFFKDRYEIDCWNTAQLFRKGHSIRVQIASSAFPKYDRNLNTGESLATGTTMAVAEQRVYHDAARPSRIILPIIVRD